MTSPLQSWKLQQIPNEQNLNVQKPNKTSIASLIDIFPLFHKKLNTFFLPVSFIDDHVFPREFLENALFSNQHFIGSDHTIPTPGHHCIPDEFISGFLVTNQTNCPQGGTPFFEFIHPIGQGWFRYQNHVGSIDIFEMFHETQQRNGLKGFSQTHLIG